MSPTSTPRRPATTLYAVGDRLPRGPLALATTQHVALVAINLVGAVLVVQRAGVGAGEGAGALAAALLMCALGTAFQAWQGRWLGTGFLIPTITSSIYLGPALSAAEAGGLPLVAGMLVFAGLVEMLLAKGLPRLRAFFPPEIAGLVILLVGMALAVLGVRDLFGIRPGSAAGQGEGLVAAATLLPVVALHVWGRGAWARSATLLGLVAGYAAALALGVLPVSALQTLAQGPWLAWPALPVWSAWQGGGWRFDPALALPFALVAVAAALKTMGTVALAQRLNNADWVRPDMASVGRGLLTDGFSTVVGAALGAPVGANPGSSNAGLIAATGVASRQVAWAVAAVLAALAFLPVAGLLLLQMPKPLTGAMLVFSACFIIANGIEMIASRMLDARRTLVIGLSLVAGLGVEAFPAYFKQSPGWLLPIVGSPLVSGTLVALLANALFRIGQRRVASYSFEPAAFDVAELHAFVERQGAAWAARRDVITRVAFSLDQAVGTLLEHTAPQQPVRVTAAFDEFSVQVTLEHDGPPLPVPQQRPSHDDILSDDQAVHRLAGYLLRRLADRVSSESRGTGGRLLLHFDH